MRMRKKKNLIPRMERCADRLIRDPYDRPGHWRDLMPQAREVHLELGCGKGRFTAGTAAAQPDVLFLAVEMVPDAMVVAMERCVSAGLSNVWFISANADQLPYFFAPGEVDRIYINFCDPWPTFILEIFFSNRIKSLLPLLTSALNFLSDNSMRWMNL